jgi:hypothetical protein
VVEGAVIEAEVAEEAATGDQDMVIVVVPEMVTAVIGAIDTTGHEVPMAGMEEGGREDMGPMALQVGWERDMLLDMASTSALDTGQVGFLFLFPPEFSLFPFLCTMMMGILIMMMMMTGVALQPSRLRGQRRPQRLQRLPGLPRNLLEFQSRRCRIMVKQKWLALDP